jgi:hypothetical protein
VFCSLIILQKFVAMQANNNKFQWASFKLQTDHAVSVNYVKNRPHYI